MAVELAEQRFHHAGLHERLAVEPDGLGVRHPALQPQVEKPHEGQPVADLVLDLVVGKVVERRQHQRLEHQHGVHGPASGARLPLRLRLAPHLLQCRTEVLPRHDSIKFDQRILLGVKACVAL